MRIGRWHLVSGRRLDAIRQEQFAAGVEAGKKQQRELIGKQIASLLAKNHRLAQALRGVGPAKKKGKG